MKDGQPVRGYKLIPKKWVCKQYSPDGRSCSQRYAVNETAVTKERPILCERGFHFCLEMKDCLRYYRLEPDTHMCEVEAVGDIAGPEEGRDSKCCTNRLRVIREIPFEELMEHIMEYGLLEKDVSLLQYVQDQTPELCMKAVQKDGLALQYVRDRTPEICLAAVQRYGLALQYVKEQTPEICLAAVQQDSWALQYVKNQTPEICLAAVQQEGYALQYVKDQTPEICLAAVRQDGCALRYVKEQTPELCLTAVKQNGWALRYVKEQTPELCLAAVRQKGTALDYINDEHTEKMCREALYLK